MVEVCPICENGVEITEIKSYPDITRRFFSCGHMAQPLQRTSVVEPITTINVSATAALVVSRLKQSKKVKITEKMFGGRPSIQFSADYIRFTVNNDIVNIELPERKLSQNISVNNILEVIQSIIQEIKTSSSSINDKQRKRILSLLEKLKNILSTQPTKSIFRKKWVFQTTTPFILRIIELLTGSRPNTKTPV